MITKDQKENFMRLKAESRYPSIDHLPGESHLSWCNRIRTAADMGNLKAASQLRLMEQSFAGQLAQSVDKHTPIELTLVEKTDDD